MWWIGRSFIGATLPLGADRVAAGVLRLVERAVGAGEQIAGRVAGPVRPAHRDRDRGLRTVQRDRRAGDRGAEPLGGAQRARTIGVRQDGDELVAAPARELVA